MADRITLTIARLGAHGDGIADTAGGEVFVPYALPGETFEAELVDGRGRLVSLTRASPDRIAPICPHFGTCGACAMQHMSPAPYLEWKRGIVAAALASRGIEADVAPVIATPPASRRRAALSARRTHAGVTLGFHAARSAEIVDIRQCAVLTPRLVGALPRLRELLAPALSRRAEPRLTVLDAEDGLDVAISDWRGELTPELRAALTTHAASLGILRLTLAGDMLLQKAEPIIRFAGIAVAPPPGAFVQASLAAQAAMTAIVVDAAAKARRIVDLFCGVGTFALPMARIAPVLAADGDKPAVEALRRAVRHATGLKPVEAKVRELFREPLSPKELEAFDTIVFDPPRAGAKAQAEAIARSKARTVIAVSCNPATLARDLRTLVDGGYRIERVTPIDQFLYSAEIEAIAVLRR